MSAKTYFDYENLGKMCHLETDEYDIPEISPISYDLSKVITWIPFNYAMSMKGDTSNVGVHFFIDDYQFNRIWRKPDIYIHLLEKFAYVLSPDFSLFTDFPYPIQIHNHYKKHWVAAYWQMLGINVIPTVCWADSKSYDFCFSGEPKNSVVAVSSVGCMNSLQKKQAFIDGYSEMIKRLAPNMILFYGKVPNECTGNIIEVSTFYQRFEVSK